MSQSKIDELNREAKQKLKDGVDRLGEAGTHPVLLGSALISLHGALEDYARAQLSANPNIPIDKREAVLDRQLTQWRQLIEMLQQYDQLGAVDRETILRANSLRQGFAHGGNFSGTRQDLEEYAAFVQVVMQGKHSLGTSSNAGSYCPEKTGSTDSVLHDIGKAASFPLVASPQGQVNRSTGVLTQHKSDHRILRKSDHRPSPMVKDHKSNHRK
jgi:hypothetical protein